MTSEQRAVLLAQAVGEDVKALREQKLDKTGGEVTGNVVFQVPNDGSLGFQFSGTDDAYGFNVEVFADSQGKLSNVYIGFPDGAGLTMSKATNTAWFSGWVGAAGGFGDVDSRLSTKVDKVAGKGLSAEDFTTAEKSKLAGIAAGANAYTHPANHPASIITQDANNRFVTDAEKAAWNAKQASLVSGTNIKMINGESLLGGGNLVVTGSGGGGPTLQGDTAPYVTQTKTYQITNYNSFSSYAVSASAGTASISGDTITFTAPSTAGSVDLTLTVDGQPAVFVINVQIDDLFREAAKL